MTAEDFPAAAPNERERIRQAMLRLRNAPSRVEEMLEVFCRALDLYRRDRGCFCMKGDPTRKPAALITTYMASDAFEAITGTPPRRISKYIQGKGGKQETGEFAKFLAEVFSILGIKASAAAQVKRFLEERRRR